MVGDAAAEADARPTVTQAAPQRWLRIPLIQAAALVSESATFPIDAVKTRMQFAQSGIGFGGMLAHTTKTEGWRALYRGLQPAVARHWVYTASRICLYEDIRDALAASSGGGGGDGKTTGFGIKLVAGFTAGGVAQLIASPADLIKVRLQTGGAKYSGALDAGRAIYRHEGVAGFWHGWRPNVTRAALVNLGELATYDQAKRTVMNLTGYSDGLATHTLSALFSGFFAALCSTPADVCKTRVMAGVYPTMVTCLVGTVRKEGPRALWKGFLPNWLRLGPWQFCFWITYEELRFRTTGEGF